MLISIKKVILSSCLSNIFLLFCNSTYAETESHKHLKLCQNNCHHLKLKATQQQLSDVGVKEDTDKPIKQKNTQETYPQYYTGFTLGLFLPEDLENLLFVDDGEFVSTELNTGFSTSILGGVEFNRNWQLEGEGLIFFGNADPLDSGYFGWNLFLSPKLTIPFHRDRQDSSYVFITPGIGYSNFSFTGDIGDIIDNAEGEDNQSNSNLALQVKGGFGFSLKKNLDLLAQFRYLNLFNVLSDGEDIRSFGMETGLVFSF